MPYPAYFKPRACSDLARYGTLGPDGYVLPERAVAACTAVLSMGLCDNWTFEADLYAKRKVPIAVFDHSVNFTFWLRRFSANLMKGLAGLNIERLRRVFRFVDYMKFFNGRDRRHIRRAIGSSAQGMVDLDDAMSMTGMNDQVLLKIDIEGGEYSILDQIVQNRTRFVAIIMELHLVEQHDNEIRTFLDQLDDQFILVHFHANNFEARQPFDCSPMVEISLLNKCLLSADETLVYRPLPLADLDYACVPTLPDVRPLFLDSES